MFIPPARRYHQLSITDGKQVGTVILSKPKRWYNTKTYLPLVHRLNPSATVGLVKRKITEAYSHIMNGVNLRYKTIDDPEISISNKLSDFIFFQVAFCSEIDVENDTADFGHFKQVEL
ncbi:hypothetical protein CHS0354_002838 [Potamilus streckersoni]|uniref:Uncharacterized protein n=1 Tax=Potamilus streckersoni TaxID=2493646 RepID=A0AAE0RN62_9BIVA|nr:hypothetical protein CHS0354_002838 [Potamilus streckersoni]